MRNVQRRLIDAPAHRLGRPLDRAARPDDPLWPADAWPPLRIRFRFDPAIGLDGHHELRIEPAGDRCVLVHDIQARTTGALDALGARAAKARSAAASKGSLTSSPVRDGCLNPGAWSSAGW